MFTKIYLIILAAATLAMSVLTYILDGWLKSIGAPDNVILNYNYYSNINSLFLYISSVILLIAGNVVLWKTRKSWAMWLSLLYFAVFTVIQTFWLGQAFFQYKQQNNIQTGLISFAPFSGVILILLAAIIVFFDQYLVKRLHDKMYPPTLPVEPLPGANPIDEK